MMQYGYWGYPHMSFWGWGLGGLFTLIFWGCIIAFIVAIVRGSKHGKFRETDTNRGLEILKERYAKGEIDKKEFEEKKKDIS